MCESVQIFEGFFGSIWTKADLAGEGEAISADATIQELASLLVNDSREAIPVVKDATPIGALARKEALQVLVGAS